MVLPADETNFNATNTFRTQALTIRMRVVSSINHVLSRLLHVLARVSAKRLH